MSSRERIAWIRLVSLVVVFVPYIAYVGALFAADAARARPLSIAFVAASVAFLVVNAVGEAILRTSNPCRPRDERDRAIENVSMRTAYVALVVLVLGAISTFEVLGVMTPPSTDGRIPVPGWALTSQFAFVSVVVAEALRSVTQVVCYRRGVAP